MPVLNYDRTSAASAARPADDLTTLARQIHAEHSAGQKAMRKSLEHHRRAGEMLIEARKQCGRRWVRWLKDNKDTLGFGQSQAYQLIELAEFPVTGNLGQEELEAEWRRHLRQRRESGGGRALADGESGRDGGRDGGHRVRIGGGPVSER